MRPKRTKRRGFLTVGTCLGVVLAGGIGSHAESMDSTGADSAKMSQLEKQNKDLQKRLEALESMAQKEGLIKSGPAGDPPVGAMTDIMLSGFVTASYFHDFSDPPAANGRTSPGYLWNRVNDNITLNKIKITLASPAVERSGDKFDVAYRASLIFGQDAPIVNSGFNGNAGKDTGFNYVREAYVEMNLPVGSGINVKAGELISLLNYESGDGGAANDNFSQGYQWFFTGNGPAAGVQLGYEFTDKVGAKVRVSNGLYAGPSDGNGSKSIMGSLNFKPIKDVWLTVNGFGGKEGQGARFNVYGGEILAGWQVTPEFSLGTEQDLFRFETASTTIATVWSSGLFAAYDLSKEVRLGLRGEFLSDPKGVDSFGLLGLTRGPNTVLGQDIASVAFTVNYKPLPRVKIQPEIRVDHTSSSGGFNGGISGNTDKTRVIIGAGVSYLF